MTDIQAACIRLAEATRKAAAAETAHKAFRMGDEFIDAKVDLKMASGRLRKPSEWYWTGKSYSELKSEFEQAFVAAREALIPLNHREYDLKWEARRLRRNLKTQTKRVIQKDWPEDGEGLDAVAAVVKKARLVGMGIV